MKAFTAERSRDTVDEFWVVEHFPVFTQGLNGKPKHLLDPGNIPVVHIDRGGQVTYHGPGQVVIYLLLDLRRLAIGVRRLVTHIEQAVIGFLSELGVSAHANRQAPGVYVQGRKIAALGLKVRQGCSYHGLAFNAAMAVRMRQLFGLGACIDRFRIDQVAQFRFERRRSLAASRVAGCRRRSSPRATGRRCRAGCGCRRRPA